eukprot:6033868-Pyramimonas_sp.AAC.1
MGPCSPAPCGFWARQRRSHTRRIFDASIVRLDMAGFDRSVDRNGLTAVPDGRTNGADPPAPLAPGGGGLQLSSALRQRPPGQRAHRRGPLPAR